MPGYEGNPLRAHLAVHAREPFTAAHFERWLELFHETLDGGWSGPNVARARALAGRVATVHAKRLHGGRPLDLFLPEPRIPDVAAGSVVGSVPEESS